MKPDIPRFSRARGLAAATFGMVALLAACEAKLPTASDIASADASSVTAAAQKMAIVRDSVVYRVDGVIVTAEKARAIARDSIVSVEVAKGGAHSEISILTHRAAAAANPADSLYGPIKYREETDKIHATGNVYTRRGGVDGKPFTTLSDVVADSGMAAKVGTTPVFIIDGIRADAAAFKRLPIANIDGIEIIKGPSAAATYGPDAGSGVIVVKTKPK